ncbi:TolC family protein [Candidatus Sumerlaeota bacterium]|nr:TolC family protein [Candidatus Sumerlaeota bacterium]
MPLSLFGPNRRVAPSSFAQDENTPSTRVLECGDMSPLSKRGHVRALQTDANASPSENWVKAGASSDARVFRSCDSGRSLSARVYSGFCWIALLAVALWGTSCARIGNGFGSFVKKRADKAAYKIIESKQQQALGKPSPITIDPVRDELTSRLLVMTPRVDLTNDEVTTPAQRIALADALCIAMARNRDYQSRKESLFQQALSLTEDRRDFGLIWDASGHAELNREESGHGTPAGAGTEWFGGRSFAAGVQKTLFTGARITLRFAHQFAQTFGQNSTQSASNELSMGIVQPLLNGAGPLVAREPLRQAERSMIYEVRDFKRYQQSFVIDIASSYYNLLQARDQLENERKNYEGAMLSREETQLRAEAGLLPMFSTDQAQQRELESEDRYSNAKTRYLSQLDRFKFDLGLPIDMDIGPNPEDFRFLSEKGLVEPAFDLSAAIETALAGRLDLKTVEERLEDRQRQARIALRDFLPNLDFSYNYSTTKSYDKARVGVDFRDNSQSWELDLGLPLDWTPRRNDYRFALIDLAQAERALETRRDSILLEVIDSWRELQRARKSYEIQLQSVHLAERSVERLELLLATGDARTRDLLDAQDDLLNARNQLGATLVAHTIERLQFYNAIERLEIDPKGMWYEWGNDEATTDSR